MEQADTSRQRTERRFFRKLDWSAFWTAFAISFAVYFYTLAPTVTLEDSGELATASAFRGVPHPPGYPIWTIITWIFTRVFAFVTYRGQPNPAFSVGLVSAVFGALATGLTAILICRSGADMLRSMKRTTDILGRRTEDWICWVGGVSGSLLFAFSSVNWSQAVIAEVYSLNAFFLALLLFLTYVWMRRPTEPLTYLSSLVVGIGAVCFAAMLGLVVWHMGEFRDFGSVGIHCVLAMLLLLACLAVMTWVWRTRPGDRLLYLTAFTFGIGLTNYQVLLLLVVSLAIVILLRDLTLFRDFLIVGMPFLIVYLLSQNGFVPAGTAAALPEESPRTFASGYLTALLYGAAAGGAAYLLHRNDAARFRLLNQYLLLSIPYVCMGLLLWRSAIIPAEFNTVTSAFPTVSHPTGAACYTYVALNFFVLALAYVFLPHGKAVAPTILCLELGLAIYGFMPLASETNPPMNWGYPRTWEGFKHAITRGQYEKINPTAIFSAAFIHQVGDYLRDLRVTFTLPLAILGFLPFTAWRIKTNGGHFRALYASTIMAALAVVFIAAEEILAPATGEIVILTACYRAIIAGILVLMFTGGAIMITLEAWDFLVRLFKNQPDSPYEVHEDRLVSMDVDGISRKWTVVTLSGFAVMSLILIMLASPKGDIQDAFIQRVKFISSHAVFSIWIGYGMIFALACVDTLLKGNRVVVWSGLVVGLLLSLEPLRQNAYNRELVRTYGGAEQNGHDFGWQFGNYQLRGAEAVTEELAPDEEPLPNPVFPPEMTPNAIFFGGTDPGRFVPTYMIYSARVREDVYLITQNALADNTYMNVMRDLYGDQIWIPAKQDSARAFQRYVEEVRSGARKPNADLKIENGRVQVSGALGVMEINGILAEMIFEYNNYKHDFYVEESYVIQWMYPYLTPHGLIMKINAERVPLSPEVVRDDMDFWDWYTRRLSLNPKFTRDIVARKSFSKLRSAIAGLYANRGNHRQAETAFQQARLLYSLSPEANFRLVQEVLMRERRFAEARQLMQEFGRDDPGNSRVPSFIAHLGRIEDLDGRILELEGKRRKGALDVKSALDLADLYRQANQQAHFMAIMQGVLAASNLPAQFIYQAATMLYQSKKYTEMDHALQWLIRTMPSNSPPEVYLNMARMYAEGGLPERMVPLLDEYLKQKPDDWKAWLDLAAVHIGMGQRDTAFAALVKARNLGGEEAAAIIEKDPRFAPLMKRPAKPPVNLMDIPGVGIPPRR